MRLFSTIAVIGCTVVGLAQVRGDEPAAVAPSRGRVTLMGTLVPWMYPGSKWVDGATMSDRGNPLIQSVKCETVLVTPDPFEKVVEFYAKKFGKSAVPADAAAKPDSKSPDAKSVSTQDDSAKRPVKVHVMVIHKADTSTTLVISRATGEAETHIAWSHYIRLGGKE